jgi:hypothetical protein
MIVKFISKHKLFVVWFLIAFFLAAGLSPTLYEWGVREKTRPERFFELVHNFPTDYNLYLSKIRQGKEGAWLAKEKYTSEPHDASLSQVLYVLIGRFADFSHVQTPYVWFAYHVARIFFSGMLLWVIWKIVEWVLREALFRWKILTFLLVVTASTIPKFEWVANWPRFGGYMPWYTQVDSLQRTMFMPHVMLAQALLIFILWVFSGGFTTTKQVGNWVFLGVVGVILGIVFPPGILFVYGVLGVVTVSEVIALFIKLKKQKAKKMVWKKELQRWFLEDLSGRIIFGLLTAPTLIYYMLLFTVYPWKRLTEFDVLHPTKFSMIEYFLALGATFPLGIIGAVVVGIVNRPLFVKLRFFVAWVVAWLVFLFVFQSIPQQSPTRFSQMMPHLPLGVFTGLLFYQLYQVLKKRVRILKNAQNLAFILPVVIIILGIGSMASSYMWLKDFVDHKLRANIPLVPHGPQVMYPLLDIIIGLDWLQVYTPRDSVVLSGETTGNYIPVYAGNYTVVGHANTVDAEIKLAAAGNFYRGAFSEEIELNWAKNAMHASYVFYGPEEKEINEWKEDLREYYPTLIQIYENPSVKIYKIP